MHIRAGRCVMTPQVLDYANNAKVSAECMSQLCDGVTVSLCVTTPVPKGFYHISNF